MVDRLYWAATAPTGLNKFLWDRLQKELGWKASDYGGMIPITTPQSMKQFEQFNKPYIVYNYRSVPVNKDDYFIRQDQVAYAVYSQNESDIRAVVNLMNYIFDRRDASAYAINTWISTTPLLSGDATLAKINDKITYFSVWVVNSDSPQPPNQEGGRLDGSLVLQVRYADEGFNDPINIS